ncbi:MAG: isoprenyl transferase [Coriobacteriia bacterium]|nr:isoprenyl transferase [Coriobacteriia bacterium]
MAPSSDSLAEFFSDTPGPELLGKIDFARVPRHVAVIMDGNGRWAVARNLPRVAGHRAGAKAVRELIAASIELGVEYLTIYSFSSENWSRPAEEVSGLMRLFVEVLERELANLEKMDVRVLVSGDLDDLPADTAEAFRATVQSTANNQTLTLVVALNYGARTEIVRAARAIAERVSSGDLSADAIDEATFARHLYLPEVPDPDLLIRTSGEMRVSNFLLWQIAYSEIWVTDTLWPDFDRYEMLRAIADFESRERRFGGR